MSRIHLSRAAFRRALGALTAAVLLGVFIPALDVAPAQACSR